MSGDRPPPCPRRSSSDRAPRSCRCSSPERACTADLKLTAPSQTVHCQTRLRGGKFRPCGDRYDEARDGGDQAMSGLPSELRDLIESGPLAHLSTINADGSPQVSVIWVGLDGDDLVSGHMQWYAKLRNIERDPRVVLSFVAPRVPGAFLNPYAVLHARATIEPGDEAWNLLDRLTKVYMSPDTDFPPPKGPGYLVRYSVERIGGVGPWVPASR